MHASVSGKVTAIEERVLLNGTKCLAVVIENDGKDEEYTMPTRPVEKMSAEAIRETVRNAGIVGMGGAGFPTHIKPIHPRPWTQSSSMVLSVSHTSHATTA